MKDHKEQSTKPKKGKKQEVDTSQSSLGRRAIAVRRTKEHKARKVARRQRRLGHGPLKKCSECSLQRGEHKFDCSRGGAHRNGVTVYLDTQLGV